MSESLTKGPGSVHGLPVEAVPQIDYDIETYLTISWSALLVQAVILCEDDEIREFILF